MKYPERNVKTLLRQMARLVEFALPSCSTHRKLHYDDDDDDDDSLLFLCGE